MVKEETKEDGSRNGKEIHLFQLYVTGASPNSSRAISNLRSCFDKHLKNNYELQIIDVYQLPQIAESVDIIALPLLIRRIPLPERRLIGDMSDEARVVRSLGLQTLESFKDDAQQII